MAGANGGDRLDDHEQRLKKLEAARKEMEDAMVVTAHLEVSAASHIKEHAEFIASIASSPLSRSG